jgi:hypothetical protein
MLRIGTSSGDFRPSHRTITLALLAVTRSTTPRRKDRISVQERAVRRLVECHGPRADIVLLVGTTILVAMFLIYVAFGMTI